MKRIYLSGPMTGMPDHGRPVFHAEAARLRMLGYTVISPAEIHVSPKGSEEEHYLALIREDVRQMLTCDTIAMLPGWYSSRGANIEYQMARDLKMTCINSADIKELISP